MSKIKEMAVSYGREHLGTVDIEVFEAGANAVLKEIEKAMKECDVDGSPFVAILDKIKELKK